MKLLIDTNIFLEVLLETKGQKKPGNS